jgi:methionyl-tRNA formyltransferase
LTANSLNIIFAGTPAFSAVILQALLQSEHHIEAVYTQPDRPAGRGRKLTASQVKILALENQLPIYQPITLRDSAEQKKLADLAADVMVVVAYGLLLPQAVLNLPRLGCINIHASLLPRWRGAAPIQRAILAGDTMTGITIMQMEAGLDTGPILQVEKCAINSQDTSATLHARLAEIGAAAILKTLGEIASGKVISIPQDNAKATYAHKIKKEETQLDWHLSAAELDCKIRAFNPWPVATLHCANEAVRIWEASVFEADTENYVPGTIVSVDANAGICVATGLHFLQIKKLQFAGGRILTASEVLNARQEKFLVGKILG